MKFPDKTFITVYLYHTDQSTVRIAEYQEIFEKPSSSRLLGKPKEQGRQVRDTERSHSI